MIDKKILTATITAVGASLCCITPVLAILAGSTGMASSFSWMEPFRPYLIGITVIVLVYAWWDKLKPQNKTLSCACDADTDGKASFGYSKTFLALITLFSVVMLSFPYWGDAFISSDKKTIHIEKQNLQTIKVDIEGMTCKACEATIEKVVLDTGAVGSVKVSSDDKNAFIRFDKSKITVEALAKAIATTGYKPLSYTQKGMNTPIIGIEISKHNKILQNIFPEESSSKCSGGKCGTGKCGANKCGTSN
jgi:copper chaperone CopZ